MTQPVILIAASGLAREVTAAIETAGLYRVVGMLDDNVELHGTVVGNVPVAGSIEDALKYPNAMFVVCAGSGQARQAIVARLSDSGIGNNRFVSVVHPSVRIPANCRVGVGTVLLQQVVLTSDVIIGNHVVAMPQAVLTHDTVVEDYATLCSGVLLGGGVLVGEAAYLGMGSSVREGVRVGDRAVLGMAAALLVDLPSREVWIGIPARPLPSSTPNTRKLSAPSPGHEGAIPV